MGLILIIVGIFLFKCWKDYQNGKEMFFLKRLNQKKFDNNVAAQEILKQLKAKDALCFSIYFDRVHFAGKDVLYSEFGYGEMDKKQLSQFADWIIENMRSKYEDYTKEGIFDREGGGWYPTDSGNFNYSAGTSYLRGYVICHKGYDSNSGLYHLWDYRTESWKWYNAKTKEYVEYPKKW